MLEKLQNMYWLTANKEIDWTCHATYHTMRISFYFQGLKMVEGPDVLSFEGPLRWQGVQLPPPPVFVRSVNPIATRAEDYAHSFPRIFRPSYGPGLDYENSKVSVFDAVVAIKLCEKTKEWLLWGILRSGPNIDLLRWVPVFGRSVNPIPTRAEDNAHLSTPPDFQTFLWPWFGLRIFWFVSKEELFIHMSEFPLYIYSLCSTIALQCGYSFIEEPKKTEVEMVSIHNNIPALGNKFTGKTFQAFFAQSICKRL